MENHPDLRNIIDSATNLGAALTQVRTVDNVPFITIPNNLAVKSLEEFLEVPARTRATPQFTEVGSFCDYINRHATPTTHIFANISEAGLRMSAYLEYHDKEEGPSWCSHVAMFAATPTDEWKNWMAKNRATFDQENFALFIEANEPWFKSPAGAELLELVTNLEGKNHVNFDSAMRLDNGKTALKFSEDVELSGRPGGKNTGVIEIPKEFVLGLAPFEGMQKYEVHARLRYRIESRQLRFWYEIINPQLFVRDAINTLAATVAEKTKLTVFKGHA